jgi:hypothetical protein
MPARGLTVACNQQVKPIENACAFIQMIAARNGSRQNIDLLQSAWPNRIRETSMSQNGTDITKIVSVDVPIWRLRIHLP